MRFDVKVTPGSSEESIKLEGERLVVKLKARAENNKANIALVKLLSKHYNVPSTNIRIKNGLTSKRKVVDIDV